MSPRQAKQIQQRQDENLLVERPTAPAAVRSDVGEIAEPSDDRSRQHTAPRPPDIPRKHDTLPFGRFRTKDANGGRLSLQTVVARSPHALVDDRSVAQEADTRPRCSNESGHGSLVNSNRIFRAVNSSPPSTAAASCLTASFTRPLSLEPFLPNMIFGCAVLSTRAGS